MLNYFTKFLNAKKHIYQILKLQNLTFVHTFIKTKKKFNMN